MRKTIDDPPRSAGGWRVGAGVLLGAVTLIGCARRRTSSGSCDVVHRMLPLAHDAQVLDHDLRGPVGAMAVALELLRTAPDAATRDEAMQVIERQVGRMTTLTERVRELAQALEHCVAGATADTSDNPAEAGRGQSA